MYKNFSFCRRIYTYVYRRIGRICNIFRHLLLRFCFFKSRLLLPSYFRNIVFTQFFKLLSYHMTESFICVTLPHRISNLNFYSKFIRNMRIKIQRETFFFPVSLGIIASFVVGDKIIGYFDRDFFPTLAQSRRYTELPKEPFLRETSNLFPCKSITFKDGR